MTAGHDWSEWEAWRNRPVGRAAVPGQLCGAQRAGEWPAGHGPQCRRCIVDCSLDGHPYGCPRTPQDLGYMGMPLRPCYCGTILVTIPQTFGPCCVNTPPVRVPGGCRYCGTDLCAVNDPDELPETGYYTYEVPVRHPEFNPPRGAWVHAKCTDAWLLERPRPDPALVEQRRQKRQPTVGVIDAT